MVNKAACLFGVLLISTCVLAQAPPSASNATNDARPAAETPNESAATATSPAPPDSTKLIVKHAERAAYPYQAEVDGRQGQVLVKMHIDETGNVTSAEALSGDELFRQPALKAAKKWKFEPYFRGGKAVPVSTTIPFDFAFRGSVKDEPEALTTPNIGSKPSESTQDNASGATQGSPPLPTRVRISQGVSQRLLLHKVNPTYPPEAKYKGISGSVVLQAVIGKDGTIRALHAVSGPRELVQSATDAVQQWRYRPYMLKGEPVEVDTQITVNYQLSHF